MSDVIAMLNMTAHIARERDPWLAPLPEKEQLLTLLIESEIIRLQVWLSPLGADQKQNFLPSKKVTVRRAVEEKSLRTRILRTFTKRQQTIPSSLIKVAWEHSPSLAIQLAARFQQPALLKEVRAFILKDPASSLDEPEALQMLYENGLPQDVGSQLKVSPELDDCRAEATDCYSTFSTGRLSTPSLLLRSSRQTIAAIRTRSSMPCAQSRATQPMLCSSMFRRLYKHYATMLLAMCSGSSLRRPSSRNCSPIRSSGT